MNDVCKIQGFLSNPLSTVTHPATYLYYGLLLGHTPSTSVRTSLMDGYEAFLSSSLLHEPTIFDFQRCGRRKCGGRGQGHLLNPIHFPSMGASRFNLGLEFDIF